ncbi:MAG: hypothetical protein EYC70_12210 [Planctomycetota bacterium]|nr:MAG: hypothetical protein EYC70_12210 [Planctomycetota bacterium]
MRSFPEFRPAPALLSLLTLAAGASLPAQDFNGDFYPDLVLGVPAEDIGVQVECGAVSILYGSRDGITSTNNQFIHQDKGGMIDIAEAGDSFGYAVAWGDFDNNGFDDLAVGIPSEDVGAVADAGAIAIIYGGFSGLDTNHNQWIHRDTFGVIGFATAGSQFGYALASGDFNGDGWADLAVGTPYDDVTGADDGSINIFYGGLGGLAITGNQYFTQSALGGGETSQPGDRFGYSLVAGNMTSLFYCDLAIGVPGEDQSIFFFSRTDSGGVNVMYGTPSGLSAEGSQFWNQDSAGVADGAEDYDYFGTVLSHGDLDGNGIQDLVVGVPNEDYGTIVDAGAVVIIYATVNGLDGANSQVWNEPSFGASTSADPYDYFGCALAAGNFNTSYPMDLAIGVKGADWGSIVDGGIVRVMFGAFGGLTTSGSQLWAQDSFAVPDKVEAWDWFGNSLAAVDFNLNGSTDLVVGVYGETIGGNTEAGAVHVMYGPLSAPTHQFWHQNSTGIRDASEFYDHFGSAMSH